MQKNKNHLLGISLTSLLMSAVITARGAGFDLPDMDAFAVARGMAVVATADNPSAIFFNPAGITQLDGNNLRAGLYGIYLTPSYISPSGGNYENQNKLHAIPQVYYTYSRTNWPVSFGIGTYTPFGLGLQWPDTTGFRTLTGGLDSSLTYFTINPVVAVKLPWHLSIAAGLSANYASAELKQGLSPIPPYNNYFEFKGDGWGVGYNLGLLWQPWEKLSFGGTFRGPTSINLNGHTYAGVGPSSSTSKATAGFNFPLEVLGGVSYRPTPNWNLEFDTEYMDWNCLKTVTIYQSTPSATLPVALNWGSSWYFEWGATRYFDSHWHVSAGYIFSQHSVPNQYYTPAAADLNRHFVSFGTGYKGKRFDFDVAYQFGYGPDWVVNNPPSSPAAPANGTYKFLSNALAVSVGWHF
jgi:long-chain fatty acid transport protein